VKRLSIRLTGLLGLSLALVSAPALADVPSLQVAPLSYHGTLSPGVIESGFVDIANPSDETIDITSNVQGFRQTNTKGDLAFYTDPVLSAAITVGLTNFQLGPRQAVRDVFNIDPTKLPQGGVYAAIFFRTVPTNAASSGNSYVLQSANVGTLLILTNGHASPYRGTITGLSAPFLQVGGGLDGSLGYKNTNQSLTAAGFTPALTTTVYPWGRPAALKSGLILPGVTRDFSFSRPGSYFGLIPLTITDSQTGAHATTWVLADTGLYRPGVPVLVVVLIFLFIWLRPYYARTRKAVAAWFAKTFGRKHSPTPKPTMDGLAPRPVIAQPTTDADTKIEPEAELPAQSLEEPPAVLAELKAEDLEAAAGLDLPVQEPPEPITKVKVKAEKPKPKRRPKTDPKPRSKRRPGRPKKST
jgi:hypothetical protein